MDKIVDFSQPIEAYHEDGAVLPVQGYAAGTLHYAIVGHPTIEVCRRDGSTNTAWTIRNVITAKPPTPSNEELTQRMEKLVRHAASLKRPLGILEGGAPNALPAFWQEAERVLAEARSIVSDLPKPVDPIDPDLVLARRVVADEYERGNMPGLAERALAGEMDGRMRVRAARSAIKLGRTLEAGGTAHE